MVALLLIGYTALVLFNTPKRASDLKAVASPPSAGATFMKSSSSVAPENPAPETP